MIWNLLRRERTEEAIRRGETPGQERHSEQTKTAAEMRLQNRQRRFKPMKKGELRELYQMMFPEYPDIVTVKELREMSNFTVNSSDIINTEPQNGQGCHHRRND